MTAAPAAQTRRPGTVAWAAAQMPVLGAIRRRFAEERPLEGARVAIVFHLTTEVANLALAIADAGAEVLVVPSKLVTVESEALRTLRAAGIAVRLPPDTPLRSEALRDVVAWAPHVAIDNADLFTLWHALDDPPDVIGMSVHSRSACEVVERYRDAHGSLRFPVVAVGSSTLKLEIESTRGTGQSVVDALIRVTGLQLSGKRIAVVGYGNVGSGIAHAARGLDARVLVVQNSAYRALKAVMDGYDVVPLRSAAAVADIVLTATGSQHVLTAEHVPLLKDGAFVGNVGRSSEEIDTAALARQAATVETIDRNLTRYAIGERHVYLMGGGHQFNHIAGGANSSELMDLSLALHALEIERLWTRGAAAPSIQPVDPAILDTVARLKLEQLGIAYLDA